MSSRFRLVGLGGLTKDGEDLASNVSLEESNDLSFGHPLSDTASHVALRPLVIAKADQHHSMERLATASCNAAALRVWIQDEHSSGARQACCAPQGCSLTTAFPYGSGAPCPAPTGGSSIAIHLIAQAGDQQRARPGSCAKPDPPRARMTSSLRVPRSEVATVVLKAASLTA